MTKLKGTIQLGEGYNRTKAIFDGNIDNLEVESVSIKDSTANDILLGNGTTLPLFNEGNTIKSQYLPSYVDDVIEAPSRNDFPTIGESGKIYLDISTNSTYRWSGSTYAPITSGDIEQDINNAVTELQKGIDSNTDEIDILKNRIISTTYSELKDAVTDSTLTTGQYYRITDYVTTCNGTSAKVTDASTIDPENPVDGQSRSAGHQFDIIVRALSPNQLDENGIAVCNESDTYYDSTFNGTVIKYSIENKYWSTEDGKGTIYYMKDHNDNECSYDFTNIEYYYAEDTTWYLTFTVKVDSRIQQNNIINEENTLPFALLIFESSNSNAFIDCNNIIGHLNTVIIKGAAISNNTISGTIDNLIVQQAHDENNVLHTNDFIGFFSNVIITATSHVICGNKFTGNYSNVSITGSQVVYNEGNSEMEDSNIDAQSVVKFNTIFGTIYRLNCTAKDQISNNTFQYSSDITISMYYIQNNIFNYSANINISSPQDTMTEKSYLKGNNFNNGSNINLTSVKYISRNIYNNVWDISINTQYINYVQLFKVEQVSMDCPTKYFANSIFTNCNNLTFTNCGCNYNNISGSSKYLTFEGTDAGQPDYLTIGKSVMYCTFTGMMQTLHMEDGSRYLHFTQANEGVPLNTYVYNVRGSSKTSYLEVPLYGDNNFKQIYKDISGRIFYTWEDNLVKKGYYINNNTDTEWKEIPTSEEPVEVPTIPDAVTTALSVATLDLTTRTTIATIATDETLAFTQVPAIQGEYRLVVVNSSEADITITMPTEENYQCLCGATLTIPAQTNIELIINVTDTLIYIRKG